MLLDHLKRPENEIEKKIDLSEYGEDGDYITVKLWKYKDRQRIKTLQSPIAISEIMKYANEHNLNIIESEDETARIVQKMVSENPELINNTDNGYTYKIEALINGIDPKKHTIVNANNEPVILDREFFENLANDNDTLFEYLVIEVEALNCLGE